MCCAVNAHHKKLPQRRHKRKKNKSKRKNQVENKQDIRNGKPKKEQLDSDCTTMYVMYVCICMLCVCTSTVSSVVFYIFCNDVMRIQFRM